MSNGCISAPCSSSASCRARSWAWAHMLPCTSTVAPKVASRSRMNSGVVSGTQTVTGIPICRPAYATASPALPPEDATKWVFLRQQRHPPGSCPLSTH